MMNEEILKKQQQYIADKMKNCVVTVSGATGLIGSRIVKYILELNRIYNSNTTAVAFYRNKEKYDFVYRDYAACGNLVAEYFDMNGASPDRKTDYVIHCAGISGGTKMHLKDPVLIFETAYESTKKMLEYAHLGGAKRFCYVSTYEIYGDLGSDEPIAETEVCNLDTMVLRNSYSECKRMCESMCVAYGSKYGFDIMCGRLTSTFGYGVKYDDPRFFAEFARCVTKNRDIVLKSKGGTVRNYLDSDDAATAFIYILLNGADKNVYNVANMSNVISIREIAEKLISLASNDSKLRFDIPEDAIGLGFRKEGRTVIDASKLYALGWEPVYSFDDTLEKLLCEIGGHDNG